MLDILDSTIIAYSVIDAEDSGLKCLVITGINGRRRAHAVYMGRRAFLGLTNEERAKVMTDVAATKEEEGESGDESVDDEGIVDEVAEEEGVAMITPDHTEWRECPQCKEGQPIPGVDVPCIVCRGDRGWYRCLRCFKQFSRHCACPERTFTKWESAS